MSRFRNARPSAHPLENRTLLTALSGTVFNDADLDGARDAGEPGLAGWMVYVDLDADNRFTPGSFSDPWTRADADGRYSFAEWGGTNFPVAVVQQGGTWTTTPQRTAAAGTGVDIGVAAVAPVTGFTLINADTDQPIQPLSHGDTIDLARVGRRLNVRADVGPGPIGSVRFNHNGNPDHRIENGAPYALAGDTSGDYLPWTPAVGTHALVATGYRDDGAEGQLGNPQSIVFNVIDSRSRRFPRAVRVNAGGRSYTTEAGEVFAADTGFRGGTPRSTPFEVDGTDDDPLYYSRRFGRSFTFAQNVPNGAYTLRLHFAEPTFTQAGRRRFDVFAEGRRVLRHYDIAADVGHQTAVVKEREVSVTDGRIDLWFRGVIENAIVSAVELLPSPQERALQGMALVNAGGGRFTDSTGRAFDADTGFFGGRAVNETFEVEGTEDDALFSSYRAGSFFTFSRPIADGNYAVLLEFAEPVSGAAAGQRRFDVSAEGRTVLDDYDIAATSGPRAAAAEAFHVTVADGALDLSFAGFIGEAVASAVVIVPTDVPEAAKPYSVECMAEPVREAISARNLRAIGQGIIMYANDNRGRMPPDLEAVYRTQDVSHQYFANPRSLTHVPRGDLSRVESAAWIDTLNDYVYVGQDLRSTMPSDTPLAYENPDRVSGDVFVLQLDGSVVRLDRATAGQRLGFDPDVKPTGARPPADFSDPSCMPDANVVGSAAHLRAIARAMLMHANENRGNFPPDPGTLVATQGLDPGVFLNPRNDSPLPPDGMNTEEAMAWVNSLSDYVYAGANRRTSDDADTVLAYENPAEMADGINILFADGRVEFREMRWAIETIRRNSA